MNNRAQSTYQAASPLNLSDFQSRSCRRVSVYQLATRVNAKREFRNPPVVWRPIWGDFPKARTP